MEHVAAGFRIVAGARAMTGRPAGSRLAALSLSRPRLLLAAIAVLVAVGGVVGGGVASVLQGGGFDDPNSDSARANQRLVEATGVPLLSSVVVLVHAGSPVTSGPGRDLVAAVGERLRREAQVTLVVDPTQQPAPALISRDMTSAYLVGYVAAHPLGNEDRARHIARDLEIDPRVTVGGYLIADKQVGEQVTSDIGRAEIVALPILLLVLVVVLGGLIPALLPIGVAVSTMLVTFLLLRIVDAEVTSLSIFAVNLVTGVSLGLAIDDGLLIVNRYREEARRAGYGREALVAALGSAGRTVLFSAATVTAAMACLLVFPERFLYSMGTGGIIAAPLASVFALTLLPAALLLLGPRIERLGWYRLAADRDRVADHRGVWYRLSRLVMRRPATVAATTAVVLVLLGLPFLRITFTSVDASVLPHSATGRQVDDALRDEFPANTASPIRVVVAASPSRDADMRAYAATLRSQLAAAGATSVTDPTYVGGDTWVVDVVNGLPALDIASQRLVGAVRAVPAPPATTALVGGGAAEFADLQANLGSRLPMAIALVSVITVVVLFVMTGSVVLPIKALLMNALSLSAAFGILVFVFQDGRLTWLLRYEPQGGLESSQPILLFAIAFGLSTDYGVFLLTRIKEEHDAGLATAEAVARGMQRTGRVVTAAALLFCIAIGAFSSSGIVFIKELGVGTAVAVALDATIVRALLVPSLMALLGGWNWWSPRPIRALHRRLGLDRLEGGGPSPHEAAPA